jgi:16S rRNA (cytidine1402-2'-O)-methyltransferase
MDLNINTSTVIDQLNKKNFLPGLYIVSTPIGNLADISVRALSLLSLSNLILCEDTRNSKKLIMKYGIKSTLKAFHKFNSTKEIPNILNKLKEGFIVSIISDAGTPLISDPGESIVQKCIDEKIPIFSVPGASSVLGGIVLSGMDTSKFTFLGFMPQIKKLKEQFLERIIFSQETLIIYESPKRIKLFT